MRIFFFFILYSCLGASAYSQNARFKPALSAIFDSTKAKLILQQLSRGVPQKIRHFWTPSQEDIDSLENNLKNAYSLSASAWPGDTLRENMSKFGIQYIGLIIKRKKYIYLNAFIKLEIERLNNDNGKPINLKTYSVVVGDGGTDFWGILYDVESQKFSDLEFNGDG